MHFTPTYSPWLNQVERRFGMLTNQKLRRGSFNWAKTADEIFERA